MWEQSYSTFQNPFSTFILSRYLRLMPTLILSIMLFVLADLLIVHKGSAEVIEAAVRDPFWLVRTVGILSSASQTTFLGPK